MNELIKKTEQYITTLLTGKLPAGMVYHNLEHTRLMVDAVQDLTTHMLFNEWEQDILLVAAWFHDSGYCYTYHGHEAISMTLAGDFLRSLGKKELFINPVNDCIRATQMPQVPHTHFQAVMCDADMRHLALSDYATHAERLRTEWANVLHKEYSEGDWTRQNLQFMTDHSYFTAYAKAHWETEKQKNINHLQARVMDLEQNDFPNEH
ncbi:hypothetical protein DIU31_022610 [Mucilaginibacter rubeus]|uniref:HD domain-containing protein n=2 Tax=Mucilaginibacter rubeus TaxID=2027860 RepID=A0A364X024_9SPHI|nr:MULTISPECIES: hypothetical protein [Mucilaginibacter]QEM06170.1 hypothetical protein DIU31_022610 [Mucilaginibacter rubeus]QEM13687.1 hypothetical protein DEO27_027965 [Mucilaginibacter rubeus]QEM18752.1 hypothetical protein DIU38_022845 [Mucilaginibacter gossypii]QTE36254.1 hypothetical protein J3L18_24455 [Mucilaginibacter gossypii]QTE44707.1 hypothetical protein J3L19_04880 [Mucilaginibacter rubeus]